MFKTRFTELVGIEYPIMQGAMNRLTRAELVAAVSNAGGLGSLTLADLTEPPDVLDEIRKIKNLTTKPFAVNVPLQKDFQGTNNEKIAEIIVQERVKAVEVYEMITDEALKFLKDNRVIVIQKSTNMENARAGVNKGVDAIGLYCYGAGGHPNLHEITPLVQIPKAVREFDIPVLMTGGIANAAGFVAALALGAEGVIIGTRFLMATECPLHPSVRKMLSESTENDTVLVSVVTKRPARRIRNHTVDEIIELEAENAPAEKISELMSGARMLEAVTKGDINGGSLGCGQVIGLISEVMSSRQIIMEIVDEAKDIIDRLRMTRDAC